MCSDAEPGTGPADPPRFVACFTYTDAELDLHEAWANAATARLVPAPGWWRLPLAGAAIGLLVTALLVGAGGTARNAGGGLAVLLFLTFAAGSAMAQWQARTYHARLRRVRRHAWGSRAQRYEFHDGWVVRDDGDSHAALRWPAVACTRIERDMLVLRARSGGTAAVPLRGFADAGQAASAAAFVEARIAAANASAGATAR